MDLSVVRRSQERQLTDSSSSGPKFSFSVASLLATRVLHHHHQQQQQQQLLTSDASSSVPQEEEEEREEDEEDEEGSDISVDDDDDDHDDNDPLQRRLRDDYESSRRRQLGDHGSEANVSAAAVAMPRPLLPFFPPNLLPPGWPPLLPPGLSSLNHSLFKSGIFKDSQFSSISPHTNCNLCSFVFLSHCNRRSTVHICRTLGKTTMSALYVQ